MKIGQLYNKDIARRINPAVVVSEMEEYFINQEIDEYVFTQDITKNIYKFLNDVANKKEGITGVWISGYYGSGKSHFIKYLFYCLNEKYRDKAFANFKDAIKDIEPLDEPNIGLVTNLHNKLNSLTIDAIIFNINHVSGIYDTKNRITRILLNQLNAFRGYNDSNIALALYLEKILDKKGCFQEFKEKIKQQFNGDEWINKNIHRFQSSYLDKVIQIAQEFDPEFDKDSLKSSILDRNQDYTIEFLIYELKDFLSTKEDNYRLLFLIDEVSQYMGSNTSLLLNLVTILEEIGTQKVWIICVGNINEGENTGEIDLLEKVKIQYFPMWIYLGSQDSSFITQKRILGKSSDGIRYLDDYYSKNKEAIEKQFFFDYGLYENYKNREDFTLTYPFIPYQFRLISEVFESFSKVGYFGEGIHNYIEGFNNTVRTILGITHFNANLCKPNDVGYFVPFDLFYEQLEKNLTHHARGILLRAFNINEIKNDAFAKRVVKVIFMVSNLINNINVNFPANVENLSLLLMDSVDTSKLDMQNKVQAVLDVLVKKNIIQVSEGKYRFFKEDEIEVANLIKNTLVTNEDRLTYIYNDIIQKIIRPNPVLSFGNKNFRIAIKIDDQEIGSKGDFNLKFSIYDTTDIENMAHATPLHDIVVGISEWFKADNGLKAQILEYVRSQKYIRLNSSSATGSRTETLNNFRETNKILLNEIKLRFEKKFLQTAIISNNQVIQAEELNCNNPASRFDEMVKRHIEGVYPKHKLSNGYASSYGDLIHNAKSKQKQINADLTPAEEELNTKIALMGEAPIVGDIVKAFEKPPYGWKDISTLDVLLKIAKKGLRRFEWKTEEIDFVPFVEKALNARESNIISVVLNK